MIIIVILLLSFLNILTEKESCCARGRSGWSKVNHGITRANVLQISRDFPAITDGRLAIAADCLGKVLEEAFSPVRYVRVGDSGLSVTDRLWQNRAVHVNVAV